MTLVVNHAKVSAVADDAAASAAGEVLPSDWNASHTVTGTASAAQLNSSVVQSVVNDTNIQGSISAQVLTFSWGGTLAAARLNSNVVQSVTNDTNVTGSISAQNLTLGWTGTLANSRLATMAGRTVKANLTSGTAAPTDATTEQLSALVGNLYARMYPASTQGSGAWVVLDPWGNAISTAGTTTQGLQELLTAASTNSWNVWIQGRGTITCTSTVSVPTNGNRTMLVDAGISINFSAQGSSNLMTFDSHENADVRFYGQVVQNSADTGACIALNGTTNSPFGNKGFFASYLEFASVAPASGGTGIRMDCTTGGFIGNRIIIRDVNGGTIGIKVVNPGTGFIAFEHNQIENFYSHAQTGTVYQIGQNSTNQANMRQNLWSLGRVEPTNAASAVVDTWGSNDTFLAPFIPNEGGTFAIGFKIESGASGNNIIGGIAAGTTPLSDSGTNTTVIGVSGLANKITNQAFTSSTKPTNGAYLPTTNTLGFTTNSLDSLRLIPTASAVNYATITNAAAGGRIAYGAAGSSTDIAIDFISQGAGNIQFNSNGSNAHAIARLTPNTSAVANGINILNAAAGSSPTIAASDLGGTGDSNIDLTLQTTGTGIVKTAASAIILNGTAIPAGGTAGAGYKFSSTANFGIFFGSGAPTLSAAKGSLFLRSDGSATNNRAYINTDGSTTWTALTTVA